MISEHKREWMVHNKGVFRDLAIEDQDLHSPLQSDLQCLTELLMCFIVGCDASGPLHLDDECYVCDMNLDEDDMVRFLTGTFDNCPYYQLDNEYLIVRHQM